MVYDNGLVKECYVCRDVFLQPTEGTVQQKWVVTGVRIGFDGTSAALARQEFILHPLGPKVLEIRDLSLLPVQDSKDWELLKGVLQRRARNITNDLGTALRSFACRHYRAPAWDGYDIGIRDGRRPSLYINEHVMVDFKQLPYKKRHFSPDTIEDMKSDGSNYTSIPLHAGSRSTERGSNQPQSDSETDYDSTQDFINANMNGWDASISQETSVPNEPNLGTIEGLAEASVNQFHITLDEFGLLFPALVPAFGLTSRQWYWVLTRMSKGRSVKRTLKTAVAFANGQEKPLGTRHVLAVLRSELSAEDFENDEEMWENQVQPALQKLHMLDVPFQED
ncbi:hypothetical protein B0T09DRAFT_384325 [Sordaria sp. MPI-SDFR-AT-0083]|nr:hypothetical protein B0T09DRAFT_384325 [Sordaria sp. MPI-SDFR-AT-0083]